MKLFTIHLFSCFPPQLSFQPALLPAWPGNPILQTQTVKTPCLSHILLHVPAPTRVSRQHPAQLGAAPAPTAAPEPRQCSRPQGCHECPAGSFTLPTGSRPPHHTTELPWGSGAAGMLSLLALALCLMVLLVNSEE